MEDCGWGGICTVHQVAVFEGTCMCVFVNSGSDRYEESMSVSVPTTYTC
jgi:hypothetical protein